MSHQSLSSKLVSPESIAADNNDWIRIEQPEWKTPPAGGFKEWMAIHGYGYSLQTFFQYWAEYHSQCDDDGCITVELQVHKSRPDLQYGAHASYGALSERFAHTGNHKTSVAISQTTEYIIEAMVAGPVSAKWEGPVFGVDMGQIEPPPAISISGSALSWPVACSGVIRLSYTEDHDAYTLEITPRDASEYEADDLEGAYQSTFFAIWAGGVELHEIDLPDMDGNCNGIGTNARVNPDDPDDPEAGNCYDLYVTRDKCTDEIKDERLVQVECPEEEDE